MGFVRGSSGMDIQEPVVLYDPKTLFGKEIRIDIGGSRELVLEFLKPDNSHRLIDIATTVHTGKDDPEDLVVLRPTAETVEVLAITRDIQHWEGK